MRDEVNGASVNKAWIIGDRECELELSALDIVKDQRLRQFVHRATAQRLTDLRSFLNAEAFGLGCGQRLDISLHQVIFAAVEGYCFGKAMNDLADRKDRIFVLLLEPQHDGHKPAALATGDLKAAGVEAGSGKQLVKKAGTITRAQVKAIAEKKMADLNANDINAAMKIIEGSCRSMGIEVKG